LRVLSSYRKFKAFVLPVLNAGHDFSLCRRVAVELVGHDDARDVAQPLEQLAEETFGGFSVTLAVDGEHPLVQVPLVPAFRLLPTEGVGVCLPELERPLPDSFVAHDHATGGQ
jgi:hypothetical protein